MVLRRCISGILMLLVSGCAYFEPAAEFEAPQVTLADFRLAEVGLFEQRFVLDLRVGNPNPEPMPIGGLEYRLSLNEEEYARGVSDQRLTLPPYSEKLLSVDLTSNTGQLLSQLRRFAERPAELRYELRGSAYHPELKAELPFTAKGRFGDGLGRILPEVDADGSP